MLENLKIPEIKDVYISHLLKKKTEREIWEDWTLNWKKKKQKFTNTTVKIGETACEVQTDFRDSRKRCTGRKEPGSHEILVMLARECLKMQKRWIYKKQEWWDWPEFLKPYLIRGDYWPKNIRKWDEKIKKEGHFVASHEDWEQLLWSWNDHLSIPAVIFHNGEARLYCSCYAQEPGHLNSAASY